MKSATPAPPLVIGPRRLIAVLKLLLLWLLITTVQVSADEPDFADQLPRIPPRSPQEALASFHVANGFRIELAAAEPIVADPIAIAFDADGRMFVVEMRDYSENEDDHLGRIRLLVDTDDDGRYDTSTVFAEGLSWPTAVTCCGDGILVAAAPDLIFLRDTDDDGVANEQTVWFTGFERSNVQGLVNTLKWGLDNRIHGATSSSGATLTSKLDPQHPVLQLRGRDFAIDFATRQLVATSGGGQHGLSFNRWGEKFVCSNSDHIQQILYEDRYVSRNPYVTPLPARISIAADGPQADVFRSSDIEPWRIVRTRLRVSGAVPGPVEGGGTAAGYFTGATGVTIFRGTAWPSEFVDYALICDVGSNLIHRKRLIDVGVAYRAERIDERSEFVTSDDIWFRPVQLANAPDGSLYVIDMYREVIEHPKSLPPVIKRHLDLTSGRNRGRIYRVVSDAFVHPPTARLSQLSSLELVELLGHPNGWHRETAARLLYERKDSSVGDALRTLRTTCPRAEGRLHALYALQSLECLTADDLILALGDPDPHVRRHAVRLAEGLAAEAPALQRAMCRAAHDADLKVRYQLAFSLGALPPSPDRQAALAALAQQDVTDAYVRFAIQTSLVEGAADLLGRLARQEDFRRLEAGRMFLQHLADQIRRQGNEQDVPQLSRLILDLASGPDDLATDLLLALCLPRDQGLAKPLRDGELSEFIEQTWSKATEQAVDVSLPIDRRELAIDRLALADWEQLAAVYGELLDPIQPLPIQLRAVNSLRDQTSPVLADQLLEDWDRFSPAVRSPIISQLMSRSSWRDTLLSAMEDRRLNLQELSPAQQQQMARAAGEARWQELTRGSAVATDESVETLVEAYRARLNDPADPEAGRQIFRKICATCHRLEDVGYELGPNLAAMQNRGAEAILVNVLDPNREVNPQYLAYSAITQDGRIVSGMIRNETATSIELVQADNKSETLLRDDLETLTSTNQSLMPTGLDKQVSPEAMKDLIGYLLSLGR